MNREKRKERSRQSGSALKTWSQIIAVVAVFLIILPRCAGCKSPIDRFWEKKQENDLQEYLRNDPEMQELQRELDEDVQEAIRNSGG